MLQRLNLEAYCDPLKMPIPDDFIGQCKIICRKAIARRMPLPAELEKQEAQLNANLFEFLTERANGVLGYLKFPQGHAAYADDVRVQPSLHLEANISTALSRCSVEKQDIKLFLPTFETLGMLKSFIVHQLRNQHELDWDWLNGNVGQNYGSNVLRTERVNIILVPVTAWCTHATGVCFLGNGRGGFDELIKHVREEHSCWNVEFYGVGYEYQHQPNLPYDSNRDQFLNGIITEEGLREFPR